MKYRLVNIVTVFKLYKKVTTMAKYIFMLSYVLGPGKLRLIPAVVTRPTRNRSTSLQMPPVLLDGLATRPRASLYLLKSVYCLVFRSKTETREARHNLNQKRAMFYYLQPKPGELSGGSKRRTPGFSNLALF